MRRWIKTVPEFDHNLDTFSRQHANIFASIGFIGSLKAAKNLDNSLHCSNSGVSARLDLSNLRSICPAGLRSACPVPRRSV